MTVETIIRQLEELRNPSVVKRYEKAGETQPYIGVMMGAINKLAKEYAKQTELALPLWRTGILDAQLLAIQLMSPKTLTSEEVAELIDSTLSLQVLDKLTDKVLSQYPDMLALKASLMTSDDLIKQRLAWRLEVYRASRKALTEAEIEAMLAQMSTCLTDSPEVIKWVMNQCLVEIAVKYPDYRERILDLTARLGVYRDMVVAKGCTSAYAPDWIAARI